MITVIVTCIQWVIVIKSAPEGDFLTHSSKSQKRIDCSYGRKQRRKSSGSHSL